MLKFDQVLLHCGIQMSLLEQGCDDLGLQRIVCLVDPVVDPDAAASAVHPTGVAQIGQVARDRALGNPQNGDKITYAQLLGLPEQMQHSQSDGFSKCLEKVTPAFVGFHGIQYIRIDEYMQLKKWRRHQKKSGGDFYSSSSVCRS